jgi:hypothetical protein
LITGTPTAPSRAILTFQVSDSSGTATRQLTLDAAPLGGFVSDPDLILHYTFDESSGSRVWDSAVSGNNHATDVTGAQWVGDGRFGGAYGPDNPGDVINHFFPSNQADLNFDPRGDAYTISVWVRSTSPGGYNTIIGKDRDAEPFDTQYRMWMTNTGSNLQGINGNQYGGTLSVSASPVNNGQWHLITMVNYLDGATWRTRLYYDDGTSFTTFITGPGGVVPGLMRVGDTTRGGNSWNGQIDDLRIYRRALSQSEVAALYNPTPPADFEGWIAALPGAPPLEERDPLDDPDGDGLVSVLEYLLGGNPVSRTDAPHPVLVLADGQAALRYHVPRNPAALGWRLGVETSSDLDEWQTVATSENGSTPIGPGVEGELPGLNPTMIIGPGIAPDPAEQRFYRTRAVPIP